MQYKSKRAEELFDKIGRLLPASHCPDCGAILDAATSIEKDQRPAPGDVTVCFKCTSFLQFDDNMQLKTLPSSELRELPSDIRNILFKARKAIHDTQKESK